MEKENCCHNGVGSEAEISKFAVYEKFYDVRASSRTDQIVFK